MSITTGPGDAASAEAVGRATRALHTPVVAYGPRATTVSDTVDLVTPAPQHSAKVSAVDDRIYICWTIFQNTIYINI